MSAPSTPGTGTFSGGGGSGGGAAINQAGGSSAAKGAAGAAAGLVAGALLDPVAQMNTYKSYVSLLADPSAKDDSKQKAAQELSEDFEVSTAGDNKFDIMPFLRG